MVPRKLARARYRVPGLGDAVSTALKIAALIACPALIAIVAAFIAVAWYSRPQERRDAATPNPNRDAPKPKRRRLP